MSVIQKHAAGLSMLLFVLLWGSAAIFTRWGLNHSSVAILLIGRYAVALLVLSLIALKTRQWLPDQGTRWQVLRAGFLLVGGYSIAYFEAMGLRGLEILEDLLPDMPKDVPVVLDAKRGDIGETQKYYAHAYFERLGVDAVTLSPFMGYDTLEPFLNYEGKGVYLLAVTSNPGSADVERQELAGGRRVFELVGDMVLRSVREGCKTSVGMVVGLTYADSSILERIPDAPLLIPGLGAQGGDLSCLSGSGHVAPPLINVSRGIMYQNPELGFAEKAAGFAQRIREALNY